MGIHRLLWTGVEVWAVLFLIAVLFSRRGHSLSKFVGQRTRAYRESVDDFRAFIKATGIHPTPPLPPEWCAPRVVRLIDGFLMLGFPAILVLTGVVRGLYLLTH